jgi:ribosomal 50S subunit-associated protein YjgA (DUF615 family)
MSQSSTKQSAESRISHLNGQKRRKQDWLVGQYLRSTDPEAYAARLADAVQAVAQRVAATFA